MKKYIIVMALFCQSVFAGNYSITYNHSSAIDLTFVIGYNQCKAYTGHVYYDSNRIAAHPDVLIIRDIIRMFTTRSQFQLKPEEFIGDLIDEANKVSKQKISAQAHVLEVSECKSDKISS